MERPRAARRWNHREPTNASRRRWSELRGRLEAKKVGGGLLFLVSAGSFASLKMANEPGRRFPGSFVVPHVPPYRLTALPPYRLTALPPYRLTALPLHAARPLPLSRDQTQRLGRCLDLWPGVEATLEAGPPTPVH